MSEPQRNVFLIAAAVLDALAALLHVGCILFGGPWYRFFGAGERIARMAERGHWYPTVLTMLIASVLSVWAIYALSGAGLIRRLPLLRTVLCAVTAVYLFRGIAFAPMMRFFPGNSFSFWIWSSAICLMIGLVHLVGVKRMMGGRG